MADSSIQLQQDGTGKKVDTSAITVSGVPVERQRIVIADDAAPLGVAKVGNTTPGASDYGLTVRMAGSLIVAGPAATGTALSGNPIRIAGSDGTNVRDLATDTSGRLNVNVISIVPLVAGSALIGDVGLQYRANATGAASVKHLIAASGTNATLIKASPGRVLGWSIANLNLLTLRCVKFHNTAVTPTAGVGVVMTIALPAGTSSNLSFSGGIAFTSGIGITVVSAAPDADTTGVAIGDVVIEIFYA